MAQQSAVSQIKGNKAKGRQSRKKKGYYDRQFYRTTANKNRKQLKRIRRKQHWQHECLTKDGRRVKGVTDEAYVKALKRNNMLKEARNE